MMLSKDIYFHLVQATRAHCNLGINPSLFHVRIFFHTQGMFQSKCHVFPRLLHMSIKISESFRNVYVFGVFFIYVFALVSEEQNKICQITPKVTKIEPATLG